MAQRGPPVSWADLTEEERNEDWSRGENKGPPLPLAVDEKERAPDEKWAISFGARLPLWRKLAGAPRERYAQDRNWLNIITSRVILNYRNVQSLVARLYAWRFIHPYWAHRTVPVTEFDTGHRFLQHELATAPAGLTQDDKAFSVQDTFHANERDDDVYSYEEKVLQGGVFVWHGDWNVRPVEWLRWLVALRRMAARATRDFLIVWWEPVDAHNFSTPVGNDANRTRRFWKQCATDGTDGLIDAWNDKAPEQSQISPSAGWFRKDAHLEVIRTICESKKYPFVINYPVDPSRAHAVYFQKHACLQFCFYFSGSAENIARVRKWGETIGDLFQYDREPMELVESKLAGGKLRKAVGYVAYGAELGPATPFPTRKAPARDPNRPPYRVMRRFIPLHKNSATPYQNPTQEQKTYCQLWTDTRACLPTPEASPALEFARAYADHIQQVANAWSMTKDSKAISVRDVNPAVPTIRLLLLPRLPLHSTVRSVLAPDIDLELGTPSEWDNPLKQRWNEFMRNDDVKSPIQDRFTAMLDDDKVDIIVLNLDWGTRRTTAPNSRMTNYPQIDETLPYLKTSLNRTTRRRRLALFTLLPARRMDVALDEVGRGQEADWRTPLVSDMVKYMKDLSGSKKRHSVFVTVIGTIAIITILVHPLEPDRRAAAKVMVAAFKNNAPDLKQPRAVDSKSVPPPLPPSPSSISQKGTEKAFRIPRLTLPPSSPSSPISTQPSKKKEDKPAVSGFGSTNNNSGNKFSLFSHQF